MLNKLRETRLKHNYTHQQMADFLNISKPFYWQIETEKRSFKYSMAVKIAAIFNMKPDEIFYANSMDNELIEKINQVSIRKKEIDEQKQ